ncbi:CocE/NonD family hydrolase [Aeromicrobium sp.]|uniref:CocE/NonD family hydrolase n=1 Tax=Aeromicrobium sp. TaxID=1871063 RepID=UPI003C5AFABA
MPTRSTVARLLGSALVLTSLTLVGPSPAAVGATRAEGLQAAEPASLVSAPASGWTPRPEDFPKTVTQTDVKIPMSDGVVLRADVKRPADASGQAIATPLPVLVTITAYNKTVLATGGGGLAGADPGFLVKRGYVNVTVDARGTGSSRGRWNAFGARENKDGGEVMEWAHSQPWSNGTTGMTGPSYMGISQLWAASAKPTGLKAIFPQVPGADVYRDIVASGGQLDVGFIPLWLGLVTFTGLIPPAFTPSEPLSAIGALVDHLVAAGTFTSPLLVKAALGGDPNYDGPFYKERSVINVADQIDVPAFFVSGEYDLFQRGTPLLFENLRKRGVPAKMIVGPWDHLQASSGKEIAKAGYGTLGELQLRWFDHWLKNQPDAALDSDIPNLTYFDQGPDTWRTSSEWITHQQASSFRLSGSATNGKPAALTSGASQDGVSNVLPVPVAGLCTRSANQWTAGVVNQLWSRNPCLKNNRVNDKLGVVFQTDPVTSPVKIQGPINAHLFASSNSGDGMLSVAVEDVAPNGKVSRLTGGWQVLSHRKLDESRTRYMDGKIIQPYHPFTRADQKKLGRGEVAPIDVEVFPTAATIRPGHRLRLAVQAFDIPHLLPAAHLAVGTLTVMKVHTSAQYPSELTLPTVP